MLRLSRPKGQHLVSSTGVSTAAGLCTGAAAPRRPHAPVSPARSSSAPDLESGSTARSPWTCSHRRPSAPICSPWWDNKKGNYILDAMAAAPYIRWRGRRSWLTKHLASTIERGCRWSNSWIFSLLRKPRTIGLGEQRWRKTGRHCPRCGSTGTAPSKRQFTFWCPDCKQRFSVRTGTVLEESRLPLRKWAIAVYLHLTNLKGVSSMKLHRDINVTQKTAWFMLQRIRKAWESDDSLFPGPVEIDETYMGGKDGINTRARSSRLVGARLARLPLSARRTARPTRSRPRSSRIPTRRPSRNSLSRQRPTAQRSTRTMQRPTRACPSTTQA